MNLPEEAKRAPSAPVWNQSSAISRILEQTDGRTDRHYCYM